VASVRHHAVVERDAEQVWRLMCDPSRLPTWFTSVQTARVVEDRRYLTLKRGGDVIERLLTVDDELHRLRYAVESGLPLTAHLGTVDVIALRPGACLVVYAADVEPDGAAPGFDQSIRAAVLALKEIVEADES
jgi:hypothetical protein